MEELQGVMDELLLANPEFTFFETCAELLKKGEINYEATEDPGVHVLLHQMFQRSKRRGLAGQVNTDM